MTLAWMDRAVCIGVDPELWFPRGTTGDSVPQVEDAKKVCGYCPVREECLTYALDRNLTDGIFGGLTDRERTSLKRRQQRTRPSGAPVRPGLVPAGEAVTLLNRSGMTDKDIAARSGIHADTISKIRCGKTTWVRPETLASLEAGVR